MRKTIICFGFIFCIMLFFVYMYLYNQNSIAQAVPVEEVESSIQITFEQAVVNRTISDKITHEQAINIMSSEREIILDNLANKKYMESSLNFTDKKRAIDEIKSELLKNDTVQYYEYSKIQGFRGNGRFKASLNATIVIANDDRGNKTIVGISGKVWSQKESGLYVCYWTEGNAWSEVAYDYKSVVMGTEGYFEAEIDGSISRGIPGFSTSGNIGMTILYLSENMNIQGTYTVD